MRILVFGAGAIGSVLGGFLAKSGHDVTLLGRPWHLDLIQRRGLLIRGIWGESCVRNLTLATEPEALQHAPAFDWIFVCVKAHKTCEIVDALARLLRSKTLVCAFQNGLGNYEALTQRIDPQKVALGRIIFGVEIEPGQVRVTVCADEVLIGAPHASFPLESLRELAQALTRSGIPTHVEDSILTAIWAKVLYNCALNGLSTLFEVPYGKLLESALTRRLMTSILEEAYQVAVAQQLLLEPPTASEYVALLFTRLIPDTAVHQSSMLQDIHRGRQTEIEALNGAIVRLGRQAGLDTPINVLVTSLVHAKERFAGIL